MLPHCFLGILCNAAGAGTIYLDNFDTETRPSNGVGQIKTRYSKSLTIKDLVHLQMIAPSVGKRDRIILR